MNTNPTNFELPNAREEIELIEQTAVPFDSVKEIPKNGLDESFGWTFGRDMGRMFNKFRLVLIPIADKENITKFRHWDLWGPFFMLLFYALFVDYETSFTLIITTVIVGASITSFNIRSLGGRIGYFEAMSILGYCILPLVVTIFIFQFLQFTQYKNFAVRTIAIIAATIWSTVAATAFVTSGINSLRRFVGIFPIAIFYIYLATHLIFLGTL